MKRSNSIFTLFAFMILLAIVLSALVISSGNSLSSVGASQCQKNAEARNLPWRYDAVGGCQVLTPNGAWIPISKYQYQVGPR